MGIAIDMDDIVVEIRTHIFNVYIWMYAKK